MLAISVFAAFLSGSRLGRLQLARLGVLRVALFGSDVTDRSVDPAYTWTRLGYIAPVRLLVTVLGPWAGFAAWRFVLIVIIVASLYAIVRMTSTRELAVMVAAVAALNTMVLRYVGNPYLTGSILAALTLLLALGVWGSLAGPERDWLPSTLSGAVGGWLVMLNPYALLLGLTMWIALREVGLFTGSANRWRMLVRDTSAAAVGFAVAFVAFLAAGLVIFPGRNWIQTYLTWNSQTDYARRRRRPRRVAARCGAARAGRGAADHHHRGGRDPRPRDRHGRARRGGRQHRVHLGLPADRAGAVAGGPALCRQGSGPVRWSPWRWRSPRCSTGADWGGPAGSPRPPRCHSCSGRGAETTITTAQGLLVLAAVLVAVAAAALLQRRGPAVLGAVVLVAALGGTAVAAQVLQNGRGWLGIYGQYPFRAAYVDFSGEQIMQAKITAEEWVLAHTSATDTVGIWTDPERMMSSVAAMQAWGKYNNVSGGPALTRDEAKQARRDASAAIAMYAPTREQVDAFWASIPPNARPSEPAWLVAYPGIGVPAAYVCVTNLRWVG